MEHLIDLDRYPIDRPGSSEYSEMMDQLHADLAKKGCAVLKGFATKDGTQILAAEGDRTSRFAHASQSRTNAYFGNPNPDLDSRHPINQFFDRSNSFIPADNFGEQSPLRQLYEWDAFKQFVQQALQEPEDKFFRYDDPLADVIINMVEDGNGFPWHFDTNNFTLTLALQNAEGGGDFQYAPWIRTSEDENFEAVRDVLEGTSTAIETLVLEPGDLQIFKGRYALHRVTPVTGDRPRYVAIFSFVDTPGMCGSPERTRQLYGRVLQHHLDRAGTRSDSLID